MSSIKINRTMGIVSRTIDTKVDIGGGIEVPVRVVATRIPGSQGSREQRSGLPLEPDFDPYWEIDRITVTETVRDDDEPSRGALYFKGVEFLLDDDPHGQIIEALDKSLEE